MTLDEALAIAGPLSRTSKMPCPSYSLPAQECKTGGKLALIEGSVCSGCYARKGNYQWPNVKNAMYRRLDGIRDPHWVEAMVTLIRVENTRWFRWHDSGDIQSTRHLARIIAIAERMPWIRFWLPTKEYKLVRGVTFPKNLTVRVSAPMVDGPTSSHFQWTSSVVTKNATCNAPKQEGKCLDCRACWDKRVKHVSYRRH